MELKAKYTSFKCVLYNFVILSDYYVYLLLTQSHFPILMEPLCYILLRNNRTDYH